jgi:hypothetical protein
MSKFRFASVSLIRTVERAARDPPRTATGAAVRGAAEAETAAARW